MREIYIKLRKKGVNYYMDYTQKYINEAFAEYAYYQTLRKDKAAFSVQVSWDDSPWLTFSASWFFTLSDEQVMCLAKHLARHFKTTYEIAYTYVPDDGTLKIEYYLTDCVDWAAVNETPFVREGEPKLKAVMFSSHLENGKEAFVSIQNYGGIRQGVTIDAICGDSPAALSDFYISYEDYTKEGNNGKMKTVYPASYEILCGSPQKIRYTFPKFILPEGINAFSTKLIAKTKQIQYWKRCFHIHFTPGWKDAAPSSLVLEIWADSVPNEKAFVSFCCDE